MAEFFLHILRYFCFHLYDHKLCKIERFAPVFLLDIYRLCFHMFREPAKLSRRSFLENSDVKKRLKKQVVVQICRNKSQEYVMINVKI